MRAKWSWILAPLVLGGCNNEQTADSARALLQPAVVPPLGVPPCDAYLARYEQCIQTGFPAPLRTQALAGLRANRDAWAALSSDGPTSSPFKKEALGRVCEAALASAERELAQYSCNWDGAPGSGGAGSGGAASGGTASGGSASGGAASGGSASGGAASGGSASGGATSGGSASGGASCTIASATELGAPSTVRVISNRACVKVQTGYPTWWDTRNMQLQVQSPGVYPAPFTWSNACNGTSGSSTFTADWQSRIIGPVSENCATLISFTGNGAGNIRLVYTGQ
jgi:hypothetical protein